MERNRFKKPQLAGGNQLTIGVNLISFLFYGYLNLLKAAQKGKKSKEGYEVEPENQTWDLPYRRPHTTNCAYIPSSRD